MNRYLRRQPWLCYLLACGLVLAWLGTACGQEEKDKSNSSSSSWRPWPFKKEDKPGKPDRIISLWSDTVLTRAGQPTLRGFGGRLMFYEGKSETPVKVDGTLVVYAFDESDHQPNKTRPDRKYVFTPQQLPSHYSKSKIGHSYSVWLPWDEVGGMQKEVTLLVRFEPKDGAMVMGEQCRQLLPGQLPPERTRNLVRPIGPDQPGLAPDGRSPGMLPVHVGATAGPMGNVQQASYEAANVAAGSPQADALQRRMTTTTIALPTRSSFSRGTTSPGFPPATPLQAPPAQPSQAPWQSPQPQMHPAPHPATSAHPTSSGQAPPRQFGFALGRQRPLGEPLARLDRDRAPSRPRPVGLPSALGAQPAPESATAAPAAPSGVPQSPN